MKVLQQTYELNNGVKIPRIGFGTWQISNGKAAYDAVSLALKNGYRLIDTAEGYGNEESVGKAIKDSGIRREEIFITSKLESHIKNYQDAKEAFYETLRKLDVDYIDLFIIHAPWPWSEIGKDCSAGNVEAYKAMEEVYREGKARAIGVSNFEPDHLQNILDHCEIVPAVDQIGYFIGIDQSKTIAFARKHGIFIEAYSPLGIGYALNNPDIRKVADKYGVEPAQVCLRFLLQKGTTPIPKSVHENRIIQNTKVDFEISEADMEFLENIKNDPRRWE